jgi:hypothetical protein
MNILKLDYQGLPIHANREAWFNATQIAAMFGRRPIDWLRLPETERYIRALCKREAEKQGKSEVRNPNTPNPHTSPPQSPKCTRNPHIGWGRLPEKDKHHEILSAHCKTHQTLSFAQAAEILPSGRGLAVSRQGGKNQCTLYALTFLAIDDCGGKLDIGETSRAPDDWKRRHYELNPIPSLKQH